MLTLDDDTNSVSAHGGGWTQVVTIGGNSQLHLWPEATSRKYSDTGEIRTVYCLLFTVYCLLYTAHCTLYTVHCTLYTVHCTLYAVYIHI